MCRYDYDADNSKEVEDVYRVRRLCTKLCNLLSITYDYTHRLITYDYMYKTLTDSSPTITCTRDRLITYEHMYT